MQLLKRNLDIGNPDEYDFEGCYTRMNPDRGVAERDLVAAMLKHRGNYSRMAADLDRSRMVVRSAVEKDDEFRALRDEIRETILDEIETGVFNTAMSGDTAQQRFVLQTLGKERGFVTREERTGAGGEPIHTKSKIDVSGLDEAVMEKLLNAMRK